MRSGSQTARPVAVFVFDGTLIDTDAACRFPDQPGKPFVAIVQAASSGDCT
jgi:hypothetical protein